MFEFGPIGVAKSWSNGCSGGGSGVCMCFCCDLISRSAEGVACREGDLGAVGGGSGWFVSRW